MKTNCRARLGASIARQIAKKPIIKQARYKGLKVKGFSFLLKKTLQTLCDQGFWPEEGLQVESPMAQQKIVV